jgi:hypothetical protein
MLIILIFPQFWPAVKTAGLFFYSEIFFLDFQTHHGQALKEVVECRGKNFAGKGLKKALF